MTIDDNIHPTPTPKAAEPPPSESGVGFEEPVAPKNPIDPDSDAERYSPTPTRQMTERDLREHHAKREIIETLFGILFPDQDVEDPKKVPQFLIIQRPFTIQTTPTPDVDNPDLVKCSGGVGTGFVSLDSLEELIAYSKSVASLYLQDYTSKLGGIPMAQHKKSTDEQIDAAVTPPDKTRTLYHGFEWREYREGYEPPQEDETPAHLGVIYVALKDPSSEIWTHMAYYNRQVGEYGELSVDVERPETWVNVNFGPGLDYEQLVEAYRKIDGQSETVFEEIMGESFMVTLQKIRAYGEANAGKVEA